MLKHLAGKLGVLVFCGAIVAGSALAETGNPEPPRTWVDKDTGHRVWRLTTEPGSSSLYFNYNAFTPDGQWMAYTAPDGVRALNLASRSSVLLASHAGRKKARLISAGRKTSSAFISQQGENNEELLLAVDVPSGKVINRLVLEPGMKIDSINADETLAAGTFERDRSQDADGKVHVVYPGTVIQATGKGELMQKRSESRIPMSLFTVDLKSAAVREVLRSDDWLNHLQFSPVDPMLLMYCHEGFWQNVDRIWTIRADGTEKKLVHRRTMLMEIAGHEFWSDDGQTIWYDWQFPKGVHFFLAGANVASARREAFPIERDNWGIHFNSSRDSSIFVSDGGDRGQVARAEDGRWISLFRRNHDGATGAANQNDFWQYSTLAAERLVNMKAHNYRLEPNVRLTPDHKLAIFRSNMFGPSYVFGVELAKAAPDAADVADTTLLAEKAKRDQVR